MTMIYGIGVDIIQIKRIEKAISRWGDRFINRVFTQNEVITCNNRPSPFSAFALRFAAKEAFSKAVGLGMRDGIWWSDIEVIHSPEGKPSFKLHRKTLKICNEKQIDCFHLSLSDERDYAIAMVVLEKHNEIS